MFFEKNMPLDDKILLGISIFFRVLLVYALILGLWYMHFSTIFFSLVALFLTFLPALIERNYKIYLPAEFELVTVLFIYMTLFLGEVKGYYTKFWWWDIFLHTSSAIVFGFVGFLIVYIMYTEKKISSKPIFIALFAFSFAVAIGVIWEIFEFSMDQYLGTNMQKLESGIVDTMQDLIVDSLGALSTSIAGFFYVKGVKGSGLFDRLVKKFTKRNPHLVRQK